VTTVGVATNRSWTDSGSNRHDETEFHNVVCWGRLAEIVCRYLKKGSKVYFSGRLRTRMWEDEAGVRHYRTEIVADDMIILSPRSRNGEEGEESVYSDDAVASDPDMDLEFEEKPSTSSGLPF